MSARTPSRERFPAQVPRPSKRAAGRTDAALTPLNVRAAGVPLDAGTREHVRRRMARQIGKYAPRVERSTVRFEDVNGPRGGQDQLCSIKVVLSALPSVVVQERGSTAREAFDRAAAVAERSVRRAMGRAEMTAKRGRRARGTEESATTAAPDRKAGSASTAARNRKQNIEGMTSALEDSTGTPSRKSTRKSANRSKRDSNLKRRQTRKVTSSKERARRNLATTRRGGTD
jgi:hypothetical protein